MIDTSDLDPELGARIRELERRWISEGHPDFVKRSGARSFAKQAEFYSLFLLDPAEARRRYNIISKPAPAGLSRHHPFYGGKAGAVDLDAGPAPAKNDPLQERLVILARDAGLICGADWGDPVHFELPGLDPHARYQHLMQVLDQHMEWI